MENLNKAKAGFSAVAAGITAAFGWFGWLIFLWVGSMVADYITGSAVAGKNGEWKSEAAREGLWRKGGSILAVLVSAGADLLLGLIINNIQFIKLPFGYTVFICPIVVVWYIVTELGSIIENVGKMGAPIPDFLKRILAIFKTSVDAAGDSLVGSAAQEDSPE